MNGKLILIGNEKLLGGAQVHYIQNRNPEKLVSGRAETVLPSLD